MAKPSSTDKLGDLWDLKALDAQIESLKSSLTALKSACATAEGSQCSWTGGSCNTAANLVALASAEITAIENEIKFLNHLKTFVRCMAPNKSYFDT